MPPSGGAPTHAARVGPYTINEEIGRGSFATVYRGENSTHHPPSLVAIKSVIRSKLTSKLLENLESEISLLKGIKQRNVVELLDCIKTDNHIYLVMAYCSAGDLSGYIRKKGQVTGLGSTTLDKAGRERYPHPKEGGLNEMVVRCFMGQLSEALKFLRARNIIHRDIKPQNLLLHPASSSDIAAGHPLGIPLLQVADFGFARLLPSQSLAETLCGSPLYMAPEILRYEKYDAKADLWSVGAVAYEMATGRPPFRAQNTMELLRRIERQDDKIRFPDEKTPSPQASGSTVAAQTTSAYTVAEDVKALIRALLKRNAIARISFEAFFEHAERVARWGEGSIAPGSIELPGRSQQGQQVSAMPAIRREHSSARGTPSTSNANTPPLQGQAQAQRTESPAPRQQPPPQQQQTSTQAQPLPLPSPISMPSTEAEQEPAFIIRKQPSSNALHNPSPIPSSTSTRASPLLTTPTNERDSPSLPTENDAGTAQQPHMNRRHTIAFNSKYVVGPTSDAVGTGQEVRQRDSATTTAAAVAAHNPGLVPVPTMPAQKRRSTDAGMLEARNTSVTPNQQQQQQQQRTAPIKSNLTLAHPSNLTAARRPQDVMDASSITNDDDSVLGKEYVLVEKRNVEINSLADELAAAQPRRSNTLSRRHSRGILSRQPSNIPGGHPIPNSGGVSPSPPSPALPYPPIGPPTAYDHPPFAVARPALATYGSSPRSRGVSYSSSPGRYTSPIAAAANAAAAPLAIVGTTSATAIARALNMASLKLFGSPTENIWLRKRSHRIPVPRSVSPKMLEPEEERVLSLLEDAAQKATVIFDFADSKFFLMAELAASGSAAEAGHPTTMKASIASPFGNGVTAAQLQRRSSSASERSPSSPSPLGQATSSPGPPAGAEAKYALLVGETLVLYIKALAFLDKGIVLSRNFWQSRAQAGQGTTADFNDYVQWFRERCNDYFEKAELVKGRLVGDIPDSAMLAEKLIFNRALEMSRAAAVSELTGDNPQECEIAYDTALWMLFAILDDTMQGGEPVQEEDRHNIQNFIKSIQGRLDALRRKIRSSAA